MFSAGALVSPAAREFTELLAPYRQDNIFDFSRFADRFPDFRVTRYREGIERLVQRTKNLSYSARRMCAPGPRPSTHRRRGRPRAAAHRRCGGSTDDRQRCGSSRRRVCRRRGGPIGLLGPCERVPRRVARRGEEVPAALDAGGHLLAGHHRASGQPQEHRRTARRGGQRVARPAHLVLTGLGVVDRGRRVSGGRGPIAALGRDRGRSAGVVRRRDDLLLVRFSRGQAAMTGSMDGAEAHGCGGP